MSYSNFSKQKNIPSITTRKSSPMTTNFAKGIYTYKPNDTMGLDELRLAQDARFDRVGEYGTRLGYKQLTEAIGKTLITSFNNSSNIRADKVDPSSFEATNDYTLYSVVLPLWKSQNDISYGVPKINVYINDNLVSSSCANPDDITTTASATVELIFNDAPEIKSGDNVTISLTAQDGDISGYFTRKGNIVNELACQLYSATPGSVTSVFEANVEGTKTVFFVFNGKLYAMAENGDISIIRNLPAGVERVRFSQNLNQIRYADGEEGPHIIEQGSGGIWVDSAITVEDLKTETPMNLSVSNIMNGASDNLVYFATDPNTEAVWTYPYGYTFAKTPAYSTTATIQGDVGTTLTIQLSTISPSGIAVGDWITGQGTGTAEVTAISGSNVSLIIVDTTPQTISSYDKFSTDFYQNFPAIKTGDPLTAMFNLGGVLYIMTRRNKYQLFMQTAESWTQNASNAQNGTFSQESVVCDLNYAYFANDNGVYCFDGASEWSLTEKTIQNVYDAIPDKENIVIDLFKNRLYVYYSSEAGVTNDHCLVYNINLGVWESFDSNTMVSSTSARQNSSSRFICGHSKFGMLMLNEDMTDNNYSDMGQAISFNLETAYQHYGTTSQLKRISKWRPEFATTENPYTCECGYALDYSDQVEYAFSIDLQRQQAITTDYVWDNPSDYGVPAIPTIHTTIPLVNGEFYRIQIRYQHIAAFEPVIFRSHTLTVQTQRIR